MFTVMPTVEIYVRSLTPSGRINLRKWLDNLIEADILDAKQLADLVRKFHSRHFGIISCPHCFSKTVKKYGRYRTWQRYKCKNCNKTFNDLTKTPFHYLHNHDKVKAFIRNMIKGLSLRKIAKKVEILLPRAFYWRHKFFHAFGFAALKPLKKLIQADDTYFALSYKGMLELETQIGRKPYKRGHSCSKRGLSKEKIAVVCPDTSGLMNTKQWF